MIQSNELRLGNYLYGFHPEDPEKKTLVIVTGILTESIFGSL